MTSNEAFKKKIRARMARTGERYAAVRRALIDRGPSGLSVPSGGGTDTPAANTWVAQPEHSDETIRRETGRGWDEWVTIIDAGPGREAGHTAIATWLRDEQRVDGWWAQGVTVGYERITGLRLPGQMPDGTFTVSRSRTLDLDPEAFRAALEDDRARATMLPGFTSVARSKPGVKAPRFALTGGEDARELGVIQFSVESVKGRTRVVASHEKLPTVAAAETWKAFWADWLDTLAGDGTL